MRQNRLWRCHHIIFPIMFGHFKKSRKMITGQNSVLSEQYIHMHVSCFQILETSWVRSLVWQHFKCFLSVRLHKNSSTLNPGMMFWVQAVGWLMLDKVMHSVLLQTETALFLAKLRDPPPPSFQPPFLLIQVNWGRSLKRPSIVPLPLLFAFSLHTTPVSMDRAAFQ